MGESLLEGTWRLLECEKRAGSAPTAPRIVFTREFRLGRLNSSAERGFHALQAFTDGIAGST